LLRVVSQQNVNCLLENQAERGLPIQLRAERGRKTQAGTAWRRQCLGATLEEQTLGSETQLDTCFSIWGQLTFQLDLCSNTIANNFSLF